MSNFCESHIIYPEEQYCKIDGDLNPNYEDIPVSEEPKQICDWCKGLNCHSPKCPERPKQKACECGCLVCEYGHHENCIDKKCDLIAAPFLNTWEEELEVRLREYVKNLPWSEHTEPIHKTLVGGNIFGLAGFLKQFIASQISFAVQSEEKRVRLEMSKPYAVLVENSKRMSEFVDKKVAEAVQNERKRIIKAIGETQEAKYSNLIESKTILSIVNNKGEG